MTLGRSMLVQQMAKKWFSLIQSEEESRIADALKRREIHSFNIQGRGTLSVPMTDAGKLKRLQEYSQKAKRLIGS